VAPFNESKIMTTELIDVAKIKKDFPIFTRKVRHGNRLIYLDSGATSQKPKSVIEAETNFYELHNSAVHRGAHLLAEEATDAYESSRQKVADFLGAQFEETIFTKSATESLNAIAYSMERSAPGSRFHISQGDEIVVSEIEHHANLIPWQELARRTGAQLKWFSVKEDYRLDLDSLDKIITPKTKVVALTHQSNVLGTVIPLQEIVKRAHEVGAVVVLDACQSAPHFPLNVKELEVDFLAFSSHKALGPTGVGVLWARIEHLQQLPPFLYGGSMVTAVSMERAEYAQPPAKFEAGVPNMAGVVGFGAAIDYINSIGLAAIHRHELALTEYALKKLSSVEGLSIIGPSDSANRGAVLSFTVNGIHPHDMGQALDDKGIAVRTGHHCAWPLMKRFDLVATTRASFYLYNDLADIDDLVAGIESAKNFFTRKSE
jgi:cysteine desulfurase/selenocysteine lyase